MNSNNYINCIEEILKCNELIRDEMGTIDFDTFRYKIYSNYSAISFDGEFIIVIPSPRYIFNSQLKTNHVYEFDRFNYLKYNLRLNDISSDLITIITNDGKKVPLNRNGITPEERFALKLNYNTDIESLIDLSFHKYSTEFSIMTRDTKNLCELPNIQNKLTEYLKDNHEF